MKLGKIPLMFVIVLVGAGGAFAGQISLVQKSTFSLQPSSSGTVTFNLPQNTAAGNTLIVGLSFWPQDITSASDSSGDTFTRGLTTSIYHNISFSPMYINFYYAKTTAGGASSITLNFSGGGTYVLAVVSEVAGLDHSAPLDQSGYNESLTPTTPWSSAVVNTTSANEYLFSWASSEQGNASCSNASTGWTIETQTNDPAGATVCLVDRIVSATGAYQVSVTPSASQNYALEMVTFVGSSAPQISLVQKATFSQQPSSSGTVTLTLPRATGAGNTLVVGISFWPQDITSVSDSSGDTFTRGLTTSIYHNISFSPMYINFYYAKTTAGGASSITLNFSGGGTYVLAAVSEVAGLDHSAPLDQSGYNESLTPTTPWSSAVVNTTSANEYLFSWASSEQGNASCSNASAGWTIEAQTNDPAGATVCLVDRIVSATGAYQVSVTPSASQNYALEMVTFVAASGGGGGGCSSAPPAPSGLSASAGNAQVSLSWNASSCATSYNIYRSQMSGTEASPAIASPSGTSYTDTGVTNNQTYYYVVTAVNSFGESAHSNEAGPAVPTAGLVSVATCGTVGQGGDDRAVFQQCLNQTAAAGQTLEVHAGNYNLAPLSGSSYSITFPTNGNMHLDSGVTIAAMSGYSCGQVMFLFAANNVTLSGSGASVSAISMQAYQPTSACEGSHVLRFDGATNATVQSLTAKLAAGGDDIYIKNSTNVTVNDSIFDSAYRNAASVTGGVNHVFFNRDTFQNTTGCFNGVCFTDVGAGTDIEPNGSGDFLLDVNYTDCYFNNNYNDGVRMSLNNLDSSSQAVGITFLRAHTNSNGRYGYVAINDDGTTNGVPNGNPTGTINVNNSSSSDDGSTCAAGRFWTGDGPTTAEELIFRNFSCTNPHQKGDEPVNHTYSAVGSFRGGGGVLKLGNIHFYGTNITLNDPNHPVHDYFEFQDASSPQFSYNVEFDSTGSMSGATQVPPNGHVLTQGCSSVSLGTPPPGSDVPVCNP